ncbi:hypothetical protein LSUB1_G004715 [Lachnellula subtilissima]|uniref:NAD(P)-binding domain-containing protein n=1 Tax=Lachnellula subtilissima TaxID=602034 RepID=A0A8H8RG87_9HELO|nr:hypothetical protein LSUB1_G004715 [Lachnellula subtilissima]
MKFIVTGSTGFIGSEVLNQCLRNPSITSIVALCRRLLPDKMSNNPKLNILVKKDFNSYSDDDIKELSGADACIWCMGTTAGDKALEIDYPLAFANAFSTTLAESQKKFRYLHLSGCMTERDQSRPLWFAGNMRKLKGQTEVNMLSFADKEETEGLWETVIVKAPFVIEKDITSPRDAFGWIMGNKRCIQVDELAAAMIDVALNGSKDDTLSDAEALVALGRAVLERAK